MKLFNLDDMVKGWFVGDFMPTVYKTENVEVGVKKYFAGAYEALHHHKVATEITVIVSGQVKMNGVIYEAGSILVISPNEATDFLALTDVVTTVVKLPGAKNDKYIGI